MLFVVIAAIAFLRSRQAGTRGVGGIPRRLLDSALTRAGSSDQTAFAAMTLPRLEQLLTDTRAHRAERRAALRSLVVLAVTPSTAGVAEHLLAGAARMGVPGVGALIIGRGVAQRDPDRAEGILRDWSSSPHPALREQAARAQRGIGRETRIEASNQ